MNMAPALRWFWVFLMVGGLGAAELPPWQSLFDGKFPVYFRGYKMLQFPVNLWAAKAGVISSVPGGEQTDLMLRQRYSHFEFSVEYRLPPGAASGIVYLVQEGAPRAAMGGLKMVLADDERHPDARNNPLYRTGSLYALLPATNAHPRPAGQWNEARVRVWGKRVEHWINNEKVLEFELDSEALENAVRRGRLKNLPDFKEIGEGYIGLEHPGVEMWFRNPRIRVLPAPEKETTEPADAPTEPLAPDKPAGVPQ
ncbi:MAG: DUF1080 domain-containing protein [Verrucomicrobiae bacterium]|nr:DUF1080 domain-containing protein [Verrucomicrobiae bacterium]